MKTNFDWCGYDIGKFTAIYKLENGVFVLREVMTGNMSKVLEDRKIYNYERLYFQVENENIDKVDIIIKTINGDD